jgi:hypothetical protein
LTALQIPDFAVVNELEQAIHLSVHAFSQQTPSTQKPDEHSLVELHVSPLIFWAAQRWVVALQ